MKKNKRVTREVSFQELYQKISENIDRRQDFEYSQKRRRSSFAWYANHIRLEKAKNRILKMYFDDLPPDPKIISAYFGKGAKLNKKKYAKERENWLRGEEYP